MVTVVEVGVALLVFAVCAFLIVRHFHGLSDAARKDEDAAQALPPGYLADTYNVRPAVTPVPKTATIQSAGVRSVPEAAKPKVAEAMVKLDLSPPRPLAAATSAARDVPAKALAGTRPESLAAAAATPTPSPAREPSLAIGPVPMPLSAAHYARLRVAAEATPAASQAVPQPIEAATEPAATAFRPYLISTLQRGTRIIGAAGYDDGLDEFWDMPASRSKSPSIWSKWVRRTSGGSDLEIMTILFGHQSVKAERLPVRAEPRRVGQSDQHGRRIRALPAALDTPSPPALNVIPIAAPAAAPELSPSTVAAETSKRAVVPTVPAANPAAIPQWSRIKRATKLVGKPRLDPDLKSKPVVATKVLGADPAPLKSRLPQTRKERRTRNVAAPVRKLYLAGQEPLPETGTPSA